jgi:hypothetical protein
MDTFDEFDPPTDEALLMALLVISAPGSLPTPSNVIPIRPPGSPTTPPTPALR